MTIKDLRSGGVLKVQNFPILRIFPGSFANQAAVAIGNARAFEKVERLRRQLECENDYLHEQVQQGFEFGEILGTSKALKDVLRQSIL